MRILTLTLQLRLGCKTSNIEKQPRTHSYKLDSENWDVIGKLKIETDKICLKALSNGSSSTNENEKYNGFWSMLKGKGIRRDRLYESLFVGQTKSQLLPVTAGFHLERKNRTK